MTHEKAREFLVKSTSRSKEPRVLNSSKPEVPCTDTISPPEASISCSTHDDTCQDECKSSSQFVPQRVMEEASFGIVLFRCNSSGEEIEVLLVQHNNTEGINHWGFPKGHAKKRDHMNPLHTAIREMLEETGYSTLHYNLLSDSSESKSEIVSSYSFRSGENLVQKQVRYFTAVLKQQCVHILPSWPADEIMNVQWVPLNTSRSQLTFPECRALLESALGILRRNHISSVPLRSTHFLQLMYRLFLKHLLIAWTLLISALERSK